MDFSSQHRRDETYSGRDSRIFRSSGGPYWSLSVKINELPIGMLNVMLVGPPIGQVKNVFVPWAETTGQHQNGPANPVGTPPFGVSTQGGELE